MSEPDLPADWVDRALAEGRFLHAKPINTCEHVFGGYRDFEDGRGGESFCQKCGKGAMQQTLDMDF